MTPEERTTAAAQVRRALAEIEARGGERPRSTARVSVGGGFDAALGGGLRRDGLHEILPASSGDEAAATAFATTLAGRILEEAGGVVLAIAEDFALLEAGALYAPGLAARGLDPARFVFVRAPHASAALWAMEEALKSGAAAAVLGELRRLKPYDLGPSRRLVLAARAGRTPGLLVLAGATAETRLSTAAETRFEVAAAPSAHEAAAGLRPLPGPPAFVVRLVKVRGAGVADDGPPAEKLQLAVAGRGR